MRQGAIWCGHQGSSPPRVGSGSHFVSLLSTALPLPVIAAAALRGVHQPPLPGPARLVVCVCVGEITSVRTVSFS